MLVRISKIFQNFYLQSKNENVKSFDSLPDELIHKIAMNCRNSNFSLACKKWRQIYWSQAKILYFEKDDDIPRDVLQRFPKVREFVYLDPQIAQMKSKKIYGDFSNRLSKEYTFNIASKWKLDALDVNIRLDILSNTSPISRSIKHSSSLDSMFVVMKYPSSLRFVETTIDNYREIALCGLLKDTVCFDFIPDSLKNEIDFATTAIAKEHILFSLFKDFYIDNKNFFQFCANCGACGYSDLPERFKQDREIVLACLKFGTTKRSDYENLLPEFKEDAELAQICIANSYSYETAQLFRQLPQDLQKSREIVVETIKKTVVIFDDLAPELQDDQEIALLGIQTNWKLLQKLCDSLRGNWEIAQLAVRIDGKALEFVSDELLCNVPLIHLALQNSHSAIQFVPFDISGYWNFATAAFKKSYKALELISVNAPEYEEFITANLDKYIRYVKLFSAFREPNREFILFLTSRNYRWLAKFSKENLVDQETAKASILADWRAFDVLSDELKSDPEIARLGVQQNGQVITSISRFVENYKELALSAFQRNGQSLWGIDKRFLGENRDFARALVQLDWRNLQKLGGKWLGDQEIAKICLVSDYRAYEFFSQKLASNSEIAQFAVDLDWRALQFIPSTTPGYREIALSATNQDPRADRFVIDNPEQNKGFSLAFAMHWLGQKLANLPKALAKGFILVWRAISEALESIAEKI